jgi:hypothetical protein
MILGAEPPSVEVPEELRDASKVAQAHLNTLDQIVAMSHQPAINRSVTDMFGSSVAKLKAYKQVLGALLLLIGAVGLFVWNGFQVAGDSVALAPTVAVTPPTPVVVMASAPALAASVSMAPAAVASTSASTTMPLPVAAASVTTPAVSLPVGAASSLASQVLGCAYVTDAMPELTPFVAQKEGRYVYVVSAANADICVVDGNKQVTLLQLKAGENRSVYGVSPWQISSASLSKVQIFFQGGRVTMPDAATRVKLLEIPVSR